MFTHRPEKNVTPRMKMLLGSLCLIASTFETAVAQQQKPAVDYLVVNQRVEDFLIEFARDNGLRVDITGSIRDRITGRRLRGEIEDVFNQIGRAHSLDWFLFNGIYYVSPRDQATTRMTRLGDLDIEDAMRALAASGLVMDRYPVTQAAERSALALSGPPKFLALAEAVIESVPSKTPEAREVSEKTIKIRRGLEEEVVNIK